MKNFFFFFLIISTSLIFAQNETTKKMLSEIEGKWEVDDNANVTYSEIIEVNGMSKEEIYNQVLNYFVYNYGSGKSVIQTQDKELGRIVAKGLYNEVYRYSGFSKSTIFDVWHIVRVDVKEGRARVIISITNFETTVTIPDGTKVYSGGSTEDWYPINKNGVRKNQRGRAFYKSHFAVLLSMEAIKKSILEGNTSESIENDDW